MRRLVVLLTTLSVCVVGLACAGPVASAVDTASSVVLSEVYGGGGNSGASYVRDFVELYNHGDTPVDVAGWSVQYASADGTSWSNVTPLNGTVAPQGFLVVGEASGGSMGGPLPRVDVSGAINLSASNGKVALVSNTTPLGCGRSCASASGVVDFVGYGTATDSAGGRAAGGLSAATSAQRVLDPYRNSGVNGDDFVVAAPTPGTAPAAVSPPATGPTIQDIQGDGFLSPLAGRTVAGVAGVVTAVRASGSSPGFWIQQPTRDDSRPAASSGLFVYQPSPRVQVGDAVLVSGTVRDYYPLAQGETVATTAALSTTELSSVTVTMVGAGNPLPPPVAIGPDTVPARYAPSPPSGNVESVSPLDPSRSVLEFWEAHEGMLVSLTDARVVGPGKPQYGEIYVTSKPSELTTPRGGTYLGSYAAVPTGRVVVTPADAVVPPADVGDVLTGVTSGPVDWSAFGGYAIVATTLGARQADGLPRTVAAPAAPDQLSVATYNVENLAPGDPDTKFARLADGIVTNLAAPDIVAVEEIQDDSGSVDDRTVAAGRTLGKLTAAVRAAGGPDYRWLAIDPVNDRDGGQPGGNIRSVLLYDPARVSPAAGAPGGSLDAVAVSRGADGTAALSLNPGRVDPTNQAWTASRKPLAAQFVFRGRSVIVVANHFNSKGGDQTADGRFQPPNRSSEVQRLQQATVLNGFVHDLLTADPDASVVLAGDFNDYQFSPALKRLTDDGQTLTDLVTTLPADQQYTYVYNGVSQVLDHILVSPALAARGGVEYQVVHVNAEYSDQASDHDPQVVRLQPTVRQGSVSVDPASVPAGSSTTVRLSGWYPRRAFTVALDGSPSAPVATVTTDDAGAASVVLDVPRDVGAGDHTVTVTSADQASASTTLTVTRPASPGRVQVLPAVTIRGWPALVLLDGWPAGALVRLSLDGTVPFAPVSTVRVGPDGTGLVLVVIPATTVRGTHTLVAAGADGGTASTTFRVVGLLDRWPGTSRVPEVLT